MVKFQRRVLAARNSRLRFVHGKRKIMRRVFKWGFIFLTLVTGLFFLRNFLFLNILQIIAFALTPILPDVTNFNALFPSQSTIIYDRNGNELYTIHGDENRFEISLEKIPENLILATLAAEDDEFFKHNGFDSDGIIKAFLSELGIGRPRGGSTITQQFVKNVYLSTERTYWRKLQEILLALKLENQFTKQEILEMYLNRIPYGGNNYGIQAATQVFLGKNVEDLTLLESAILAGIPQAPTRYSPNGPTPEKLMGFCADSAEIKETVDPSRTAENFELRTTGRVWLRITTDGVLQKEWIAEQNETHFFPFQENFEIHAGNQNYQLFLGETEILTTGERIFSFERDLKDLLQSPIVQTCQTPFAENYTFGRKDYVLNRMLELKMITEEEFLAAFVEAQNLQFKISQEQIKAPHFVFFVREFLERLYGQDLVERGGLRVITTLDPDLQKIAEDLVAANFPKQQNANGELSWSANLYGATNAALLALDNQTGQILAMVGSRDYFENLDEKGLGNDGATNLTIRERQPGSSFKPFVYAAGFSQNLFTPASVFWDVETNFGGFQDYTPQNYDGNFLGPISLRQALAYSRNVPAVKAAALLGEAAIVNFVKKLGFESIAEDGRYGTSIGLGVSEVTMLEMLVGYSVFANNGNLLTPIGVLRITDSDGNLIEEFKDLPKRQVIEPEIAYLINNILADSEARPEGWNNNLALSDRPNAAKTGTANKRISENLILPRDTWTFGYTPQLSAAVWVGNNNGAALTLKANGLQTAGPLWKKFMEAAHQKKNLPSVDFSIPANIVKRSVAKYSGLLASDVTPIEQIIVEIFPTYNAPLEVDQSFSKVTIDVVTGKLPTEFTPAGALQEEVFLNLKSEMPGNPHWEEPVQTWLKENLLADFSLPPTEFDELHTAETAKLKPTIKILAPGTNSTVGGRKIGVWVEIQAPQGVEKVEFYRDDYLIFITQEAPYKGLIPISFQEQTGDKLVITAKVFDKLYYTDSSRVKVVIGEDTQKPTVSFKQPKAQQEVQLNSRLKIEIAAIDAGSDVAQVELFLGNQSLTQFKDPPFEFVLNLKQQRLNLGKYTLRAEVTDLAGNEEEAEVVFQVVE